MLNKSHSCPSIHALCQTFNPSLENKSSTPEDGSTKSSKERYQVFRICKERCKVLNVTIEKGVGITRGKIKDWRKYENIQDPRL